MTDKFYGVIKTSNGESVIPLEWDYIYDKALRRHNNGTTAKDTADAMIWVAKIRQSTRANPFVIYSSTKDYLAIFCENSK